MAVCSCFIFALTLGVVFWQAAAQFQDAAHDGPRLVWTELLQSEQRARINSLPADPGNYVTSTEVTTRYYYQTFGAQFVGIANDYANRTAFWSATSNRTIYRGGLGIGASGESIFKGTSKSVEGLAVDWLAKNIYWTDSSYDWIMISDYDATFYNVLFETGLEKPRGIATFPQRGYLFWTDWGERKLIERSTLGGKNRTTIVDSNLHFPNGITVDFQTERVYWVDAEPSGNRIESCHVDGSDRALLVEMEGSTPPMPAIHFFDLEIYRDSIYVTDLTRHLRCFEKRTGKERFSLNLGARPFGLMTYGPGLQPNANGSAPCDNNPCEHLCTGTPEFTYQCLCSHGYQLAENGTSCITDENKITKPQLLFVTRNEIRRYPANFPDQEVSDTQKNKYLVTNRTLLVAIDVDTRGELMFFSDYGKREIYSVSLVSGQSIKTIVGGVGSAEGLAVDWLNQNLYWADAVRRHIAVSRYDGKRRKIIFVDDVIRPRSIVIHAERRFIFWTEFGPPSQIERGNLDGTGRVVIKTGLGSPNGLAIDFKKDRLYFATRDNGAIECVDFDGTNSARIIVKRKAKYFDIEVFRDYLFFSEWGTENGLHAVNLNTNELVKSIMIPKTAYGLRMYDDSRQPDGPSVCGEDTCAHLCLPRSPDGFVCHCSIGYTLDADNFTCNVDIQDDNFVLVADTHIPGIFQISMESSMERFTALPLEGIVRPIALAFDPVERRVYWTDVRLGSFSRAFLNGTGQEVLGRSGVDEIVKKSRCWYTDGRRRIKCSRVNRLASVGGPDGLTIDPISRLLYWTDVFRNTITVSSLDGTKIKTLINTDLDQPRAIVLDPVGGYMYYSDWGVVPKIEKAYMDGSSREVLVDSDIAWPNGLALDLEGSKLYWGDAKIDRIESINLDGTGRQMIVNLAPRGHPYGVAIYGSHVYWSDWKMYGLMQASKTDGAGVRSTGPQTFTRISEIHIYNSSRELSGSNACSNNSGGCSDLCIPTPLGRVCACPDGIALDADTNTTCLFSNLTCNSSVGFGHFLEDCSFEPGRRCTVECDPGYWSVTENYDLLCLPSGQWDVDMDAFCTVVECPELNVTENASVLSCAEPPLQNSTCEHECNLGYKWSSGTPRLTCEKDGTWSGPQLYCTAVTCVPLEAPENGLYQPSSCTVDGGDYQDRCMLFCMHSYVHRGISMRTCELDGHWTDETMESACVDLEPPTFGNTCPDNLNITADRGQTTVFLNWTAPVAQDNSGGDITYSASDTPPYLLKAGEHTITVVANDAENNTAVCEFVVNVTVQSCDYLSIPLNGYVAGNCTYYYGSVCHFTCNQGHRLIGSSTRTCDYGEDGQLTWIGDRAQCEAVTCPSPERDPKVYQSGCEAPYMAGLECAYMCAPGYYQVNGSAVRTCQDDGTWTGETFFCHVKVCDPIAPFEHGVIEPASCSTMGGTVHNVCNLSCREGFELQGKVQHTCLETGEWSNFDDVHYCEDDVPPHFNDTCPQDFTVTAPPHMTQANVTWDVPQAVDIHSQIWNVTSSRQPGVMLPEGTHAVIITATDSVGNTQVCRFYATVRVIRCPQQLAPRNSHMLGSCHQTLGANCTLGCQTGFTLSGASTKKCAWDGESESGAWQWEGNDPVCQAVMCPPFEVASHMMVFRCPASTGRDSPYGSRCSILCGRRPSSLFFAGIYSPFYTKICQANGMWSGPNNTCQENFCPALTIPENARLQRSTSRCTSNRVTAYTSCVLACLPGYRLRRGPATFRCLSSGRWNPSIPETLDCLDFYPPEFSNSCPNNVTVYTPPCSVEANVSYPIPVATDNDGEVQMTGPGDNMPMLLRRGNHERMYVATDRTGNSATCVVNIKVIAPTCAFPSQSSTLRIDSTSCRNLYGTTVRYSCRAGYRLIGSQEQVCQMNRRWRGTMPRCVWASCPRLVLPEYTVASPRQCSISPLLRGATRCKVVCRRGFQSQSPPIYTTCTSNSTWSTEVTSIRCIDVEPPVFSYCPSAMTIPLPPSESSVSVNWRMPTARDNGGGVNITHPDVEPPIELVPSSEVFTYIATDDAGLTTRCSFEVTVVDREPPVAINCPTAVNVIQADTLPVVVVYQEPTFDDNVGIEHVRHVQWYTRIHWVNSRAYEWGYTEMHYQALDRATNAAICNLKYEIVQSIQCPSLVAPPHSELTCDPRTLCSLSCSQGYVFESGVQSPLVYQCQASGLWNHSTPRDENPYLPVCTRGDVSSTMRWDQTGQFAFTVNGDCHGAEEGMQQQFTSLFRTSNLFKSCLRDSSNSCEVSNIQVSCNATSGIAGSSRRRRKRQSENDSTTSNAMVSVTMVTRREGTTVPPFFSDFNSSVSNLWSENNVSLSLPNLTAVLDTNRSGLSGFEPLCSSDLVAVNFICVPCPPGTYHNAQAGCVRCGKGHYQDLTGQSRCKVCERGMSTRASGAYLQEQCQVMCGPGTYSYLGLEPDCLDCTVGSYQRDSGQRGCRPCRGNKTTSGQRSTSASDCVDPSDVVLPLSTTDNDISEMTPTSDTNSLTDRTPTATVVIESSPAIVITTEPSGRQSPVTMKTDDGRVPTPGSRTGGRSQGMVIGICFGILVVIVAVIAVIVVFWRRRSKEVPMMKLTSINLSSPEDYESDDDPADGKYHKFQEMDDFDLEHLTLTNEDHAQAKRNSFSNALYQSEDDPKQDEVGRGWTRFNESQQ